MNPPKSPTLDAADAHGHDHAGATDAHDHAHAHAHSHAHRSREHDGHGHGHSHGPAAHSDIHRDHAPTQAAARESEESCGSCCGAPLSLRPAAPAGRGNHAHAEGEGEGDDHDHGPLPALPRIVAALAVAVVAELAHLLLPETAAWRAVGMGLAAVAILLSGLGIYASGLRSLARGKLGIDALMTVAVTGAFVIGQWPEAAMVMALYALAEYIEHCAADRARNAIAGLMALAPDEAQVQAANGRWERQPVAGVPVGAVMRVGPGERVPLDGTVTQGHSAIDQASVTGESIPVDKGPGDAVFAATVNQGGELLVQVTARAGQTTLDRIIEAVEQAQSKRAPTQRFVERFAAIYTPTVFALAVAVAVLPPLLLDWSWLDAIYKALVMLVIACPCALVISTPVTVVSGLTAAARRGILIKGGTHLENARNLKAVALDKTGTLTEGKPRLVHWQAWGDADATQISTWAASLAARSDHPVSRAIAAGLEQPPLDVQHFNALIGRGSEGQVQGRAFALGNHRLAEERGVCNPALEATLAEHEQQGRTVTLLMDATRVHALFAVADTLRPGARQAIADLQALGVTPVMLSGDNPATALAVAREAGIADARGGLLPEDKLQAIREMQTRYGPTGMSGDGINDAPALAQADIGFAMGAVGTDIAMEAADVVIMNDELGRIAETVRLSGRTHALLWQNISLALGIKAVFFVLALMGSATMWMAVFADMGASLLVVANGLRLLRARPGSAR